MLSAFPFCSICAGIQNDAKAEASAKIIANRTDTLGRYNRLPLAK
jgi:hypothetical protein